MSGVHRHNNTELGSCLDTYLRCTGFKTVSIISPAPCDKHNFHKQVHQASHVSITSPAPYDKHYFCISVHPRITCFHYIPSFLCQTLLLHICPPKCHMFPLHPQLTVTNTASACMLTQVSHVDHQLPVTNTTSTCMHTRVSHIDLHVALVFLLLSRK